MLQRGAPRRFSFIYLYFFNIRSLSQQTALQLPSSPTHRFEERDLAVTSTHQQSKQFFIFYFYSHLICIGNRFPACRQTGMHTHITVSESRAQAAASAQNTLASTSGMAAVLKKKKNLILVLADLRLLPPLPAPPSFPVKSFLPPPRSPPLSSSSNSVLIAF